METLVQEARRQGPIPVGAYRAMVLEGDLRISSQEFSDLEAARSYTNDAASEADDRPPIAVVLDSKFDVVHHGRPYWVT